MHSACAATAPCCFPGQNWRDVRNWCSTRKATPLEYSERLLLLNEVFRHCDTHLLGFADRGEPLHAVTMQLIAGAMVPFDVIPIRCEGGFLEMTRVAETRMKG